MFETFNYIFLERSISTNMEIKNIKEKFKFKNSIALLSKVQTGGKGRSNNKWYSNDGDLTCSFLVNQKFKLDNLGQLNILMSVSIIQALKKIYKKLNFKLKWPNDIYLNEKKIGGILIETNIKKNRINYLIVGVGINIISSPNNLNYETTKLSEFSKNLEPKKIFFSITDYIFKNINDWEENGFSFYKKTWLKNSKDLGKEILIRKDNKFFNGKFLKIDDNGSIMIKNKNENLLVFPFGEVI
ncbi:MAG: biotin--[acetyl-CoA-carboxylase] ligase [Rickettsiales bacterium]|nr:biotin--[acetyl-CoA-carboxylase] ligase [Rickettsiales bacterium]